MELTILNDIVIIFGLAIGASFLCRFLRISTILGFLLAGALAGPHGFALIKGVHEVEVLSEIGVILLLFSIGLEFSLDRLLEIKRAVYLGGGIQVGLTFIATLAAARWLDFSWPEAVFIGFLLSLSSTAVVLKLLQEKSVLDSPYGRTTLGILLFQDIMIVPMMIVTPMLGGAGGSVLESLALLAGKTLLLVVFIYLAAKWLIPFLLHRVAGTRSSELFLLMVVFIAFALAWTTSLLGMSLALGAFLAGLMIAESEYELQAISNILPFRDIFMSFFFISVGMLFDGGAALDHAGTILLISLALILLKFLTAGAAAVFLGFSLRTVLLVGFALVQIGEFSFILARVGWKNDLLPESAYPIFIAVTVITLVATPFVMGLGRFADSIAGRRFWPGFLRRSRIEERAGKAVPSKSDHVIIVGFGLVGRHIAHAARASDIAYTVIELNPNTVRRERKAGESILYGDATYREVLLLAFNLNFSKSL